MWHRDAEGAKPVAARIGGEVGDPRPPILDSTCRRAYYRVAGLLPIRLTPLSPEEVDDAVFDLSLHDPLLQPIADEGENAPLMARLRRIEEKLDLLLGASRIDVSHQLCGQDRQSVVFSGSGLSLDVTWSFEKGDAYRVEVLLPSPYTRVVRSVAIAVQDSAEDVHGHGLRPLAVELIHMEAEERDALIAYSYDLQRVALRARGDGGREV